MTVLIWRLGVAYSVILILGQEDDTHMVAWIKGPETHNDQWSEDEAEGPDRDLK